MQHKLEENYFEEWSIEDQDAWNALQDILKCDHGYDISKNKCVDESQEECLGESSEEILGQTLVESMGLDEGKDDVDHYQRLKRY